MRKYKKTEHKFFPHSDSLKKLILCLLKSGTYHNPRIYEQNPELKNVELKIYRDCEGDQEEKPAQKEDGGSERMRGPQIARISEE